MKYRFIKNITLLLFLLLSASLVHSQGLHKIDSLKSIIEKSEGLKRYENQVELTFEYYSRDKFDEALIVATEANQFARNLRDTAKIVVTGRLLGIINRNIDQVEKAEKLLLEVLPMAKNHSMESDYRLILNSLALVYTFQAKYDKALYYHFKSLELKEKIDDKPGISVSLNNIGLVYYLLNNYDKAILYYKRSLEIKRKIINAYDLDRLLINLSLCYINKKEFSTAKKYLNESLNVCKENCSTNVILENKLAEGDIAFGENRLEDAANSYLKSYKLSCEVKNIRYQFDNLISLAEIYNKKRNFSIAKSYLNKAEELGEKSDYNLLKIRLYKHFSFLHNQTHDYKNAVKYQAKYITLRDSIYSEELTQNLMVVHAEYEQRENKVKIESQNKVLTLKEEIISRQNILGIAAGAAIALLALLILALYRNNKQKKTINAILEQKVQERTRELEVSYALIQKAYSDQNNFIEKASNDIRGPLSTIKGFCSLGLKEVCESEAQQYLIQVNETTYHLEMMINKLVNKNQS